MKNQCVLDYEEKQQAHAKSQPRNSHRTTRRNTEQNQRRDTKRDASLENNQNNTPWRTTYLEHEIKTSLLHRRLEQIKKYAPQSTPPTQLELIPRMLRIQHQ